MTASSDLLSRYAPLSGLAVFVLFGVGNALWAIDIPATDASPSRLAGFYEERSTRIIAGASLSMLAVALFVWFGAVLRDVLATELEERGTSLPGAAFGGVLLASAAGLGAETVNMAGALRAGGDAGISPAAAQAFFDISQVLGFNAAGVGLAVVLGAVAGAGLRGSRLLPRFLAVPLLVLALTLLTPLVRITFLVAFLLLPYFSLRLYRMASS